MPDCCKPLALLCRLALICTAITGVIFSIMTVLSCDFVEFAKINFAGISQNLVSAGHFKLKNPINNECEPYNESLTSWDQPENTSRTCAALSVIFGATFLIFLLWEFICCKIPCAKLIESSITTAALICQGLTFLFYNGSTICKNNFLNIECQPGKGSQYSILAMIFYAISGVLVCCTLRPDPIRCSCSESTQNEKTKDVHKSEETRNESHGNAEQKAPTDQSSTNQTADVEAGQMKVVTE